MVELWWNYGGIMVELWWNYGGIMAELWEKIKKALLYIAVFLVGFSVFFSDIDYK